MFNESQYVPLNKTIFSSGKLPNTIFIFISFLIFFNQTIAQPNLEWVRLYPDSNTIYSGSASALALDDSGNVYVAGYTTNNSTWDAFCTIKYSGSGVQQWAATFTGPLSVTYAGAIALDDSSNVYVTGYSNNGSTFFDFCTVKYNSNGVQQWIKYYNGTGNGDDEAKKIAVDNAGNIYVTGFSQTTGGGFVYATVKYSTDGMQIWARTYPLTGSIVNVTGIKVDESCNVYITGDFIAKAVTVKYDSSGNQLWGREYSGFGPRTEAKGITLDKDNNVYVAGNSKGIITASDFFTIKYTSAGNEVWVRRYNTEITAYSTYAATSIVIDKIGNVLVSGTSTPNINLIPARFLTIKYSNMGDTLWVRQDTTNVSATRPSIITDIYSNIYIAGTSWISGRYAIATIKYDSSGFLQWRQIYNSTNSSVFFRSFDVDNNFNIYLTGSRGGKMCTIKYSQITGIVNNTNQVPRFFILYQNYPNPFNPVTKIKFDVPASLSPHYERGVGGFISLKVFDILGHEVTMLVNEQLKPGTYEVEWDGSSFASGIYYYRLITGEYVETRKMILIK